MGGCSSRPKTVDFEGVLGLQEENLQEEASRKNLQVENAGWEAIERQQEVCELPIQTRAIEIKGHDETHNVPALPEKQLIEVFKEGTLVLQGDSQHVKHVLEETINESGLEKELLSNQELLKLSMTPDILVTESSAGHDDSVLIIDFTKESEQEEASKSEMESEHHNTVNENGEQRCDEHVTSQEQDEHSEEGIKECKALCKESEAGACEVVRAARDDVLDRESEKEVLKDFSKPIGENMITGEACKEAGEDFLMDASNDTKSPVAETSDQESSKEIANTYDDHLAIIADAITDISQQGAYEKTKEQEANVDAAASKSAERFVKVFPEPDRAPIEDKMALKDVTPQADSHLVNDVHVRESSVESLDTVDGEDELVCGKNCFNGEHRSQPVVGEESSHLKLETSSEDAQENEPCAVSFDYEGQQKSDGTSIPNGVTAFQVTATAKKPEAQSVCAIEFAELACIPAQDIPAPDIDEVLEKLASEFERQERVACATP